MASDPKYSVEFSPRSGSWVVHISGSDVLSSTDFFVHTMLASGITLERIVVRIPNLSDETVKFTRDLINQIKNNEALLEKLNCFSVKHGKACSGGSEKLFNDELVALEMLDEFTNVSRSSSKQMYSEIGTKLVVAGGESIPIGIWYKSILDNATAQAEIATAKAEIAEKKLCSILDMEKLLAEQLSKSGQKTMVSKSEVLCELNTIDVIKRRRLK